MELFKKLQENSLYWRYRFVTRRYLALKRWWRELRQSRSGGRVMRPVPRGMAAFDPYGYGKRASAGVNTLRGIAFVVVVAAAWTALGGSALASSAFPVEIAQLLMLGVVAYLFVRFW